MSEEAAVLDANVLYSSALRDFFMRLSAGFLFQPKWTDKIHEEWIGAILKTRSHVQREDLERTRDLMSQHGRNWHVPSYEHLVGSLVLPDADDRHVLAAAIATNAPFIVTFNLSDFPNAFLMTYKTRAIHSDAFALALLNQSTERFLKAVKVHRASLKNPTKSQEQYLETLRRNGLTQTSSQLEQFKDEF